MCRLLGVIANKEVDIDFSFNRADKSFKNLLKSNPDGWGIGYYVNGNADIQKEGLDEFMNIENYNLSIISSIKSKIIISHVRKATIGNKSKQNSHPFKFKDWIFAHNGSVNRNYLLDNLDEDFKKYIEGETDSEIFFLLLMQEIEKNSQSIPKGIRNALKIIYRGGDYSGLNFIMSDGQNLYAFRDAKHNESYYSLYFLNRDPSKFEPLEYFSKETRLLIESKSLLGEKAVLICSEKLTKEEWKEIPLKTLIIINSNLEIRKENL